MVLLVAMTVTTATQGSGPRVGPVKTETAILIRRSVATIVMTRTL
jgi:hypothetical protein